MNKVKFKLNSKGVQELLKSPQMQGILREKARSVASNAGQGYFSEENVYTKRAVARVYAGTYECGQQPQAFVCR